MPKYLTNASMGYTGPPPLYDHVYTNTRILLEPWWRYPGEETCSRHPLVSETARLKLGMEGSAPICPGVQQTWVRDLDGSLLRESGVALPTGGLLPSSCDSQTSSFALRSVGSMRQQCNIGGGHSHTAASH
ncbi:unnamed protein product [Symbiodinium necroappetens]|uniref:Uncharacterized protein n=1 Tax=Symbiodinium necroappetens TaxID=1628268 RepID=A0A812ZKT4_9DINO|nr:unnamed protein product [Symbiodinium necroappetens]